MEPVRTSKEAYVIGARETVRGFQLIGVPGCEVASSSEALDILNRIIKENYTLIIISSSVAQQMIEEINELRKETTIPIIVVSDANAQVEKDYFQKMFRSFLGF